LHSQQSAYVFLGWMTIDSYSLICSEIQRARSTWESLSPESSP
jgi:hypothetical protein